MKLTITFAPVRRDETLFLERLGTVLFANGAAYDLAALAAEEADSPGEGWVPQVALTSEGYAAVVLLPHGADAPDEVRFPQPVVVETDGEIALPG